MKSESGRSRRLLIALFICLMAVCVGLACVFTACKSDDARDETEGGEAATVTGLSLSAESLTVYAGSSSDFTVTVTMSDNTTSTDYTVVSGDESVATVSQSGSTVTVTGVAAGDTKITVTAGEFTASCAVTVSADSVATVELSKDTVSVPEDGTTTITVTVKMTSGATSTDFTAVSADTSIATVDVSGSTITVTGVAVGETKITVTAGGITKECEVEVTTPVISKVTLSKSNVTIGTGETASVDVTVTLDNGKTTNEYTASASCEPENIVTASVTNGILTITADATEGSVKITVTVDGTTISTECSVIVADVQKEYHIDFSDPDTYTWIGTPATPDTTADGVAFTYLDITSNASYTTGILTFQGVSGQSINKENVGALYTSSASGSYFMIDLSAFDGSYVDISVDFCANGNATRSLYVTTSTSTSPYLKSASSDGQSDIVTLAYSQIISAGDVLYLTWSTNLRIFSIDIEIVDDDPNYCHCTTPSYPETTDTEHVVWDWENRDEESQKVNVTIYCAECGKIIVSEDTEYDVDTNDETKWYASVSEGNNTYESTYDIPQEGVPYEHTYTYSYSELLAASGNVSSDTQLQAGWFTGSNEFLTYSGSSSNDKIRPTTSNGVIEIRDGTLSVTFKGTGSLTVSVASTGSRSGNISSFALRDSSGKYVEGTYTNGNTSGAQIISATNSNGTFYKVNYATACEITFEITTPGTYTLVFNIDNSASASDFGLEKLVTQVKDESGSNVDTEVESVEHSSRATRITAIVMKDTFADGGSSESEGGSSSGAFEEKEGYEWVKTAFDYTSALAQLGETVAEDNNTFGIFSFDTGITMESSDIKTGGGRSMYIELQGEYNYISLTVQGASSNANGCVVTISDAATGQSYEWTTLSAENKLGNGDSCDYTISGLSAGKYEIHTSVSGKITNLVVYQYREEGDPESITAVAGVSDFLFGRTVGETDLKLNVTLNYTNGNTDALTMGQYTTDAGNNRTWTVGENVVKITYSPEDGSEPFEYEVKVYFYQLVSVEISDFSMEYTNSTYYTNSVQKVYLVGDSVSYDYAAVTAKATYTDTEGAEHAAEFVLTADEVNFALYDETNTSTVGALNTAGTYTVRATADMGLVSGTAVSDTYTIHVVNATGADITTVNVVHPTEDTDGTETETATYEADSTTGIISVSTITDAIQLIKLMGATDAERKFIYVGEGQYWEKIYIDTPNLSLIGANSYDTNDLATRQEKTEIVYDAMNGVMDPSGSTTYSTVGSATVTVAKEAVGFYAANITFRNYWNTNDLYNQALEITSSTQADAAYINADRSYFYNVTFTGYHDTLEAENGRQVYDHCYIEGRTDFIFGATATCYFKDSTIHSIGAGTDQSNGGYVVAYKGTGNAGTVDYGYIFDECNFEGDENVKAHSVALGRAWDQYLMMVVMNCTLDDSYAMGGYDGSSNSVRYCKMNAEPNLSRIYEYNNTNAADGGSVIDSTTEGYSVDSTTGLVTDSNGNSVCTIPSAEQAAKFADASVIFAATNGTVSYGSAWDGKCDVITITVMNGDETVATVYGTGSMSVSDLKEAVNARLTDAEVGDICDENNEVIENAISETSTVYISTQEPDPAIKENLYYEYSDFAALTAEEDGTYSLGGITIDLGDSGTFASNNGDGKWFVLTGTTTFTLQVKAGTSIDWWDYQSGLLALTANGETVTLTQYTTSSECLYRYRASVDSELVFSIATDKNQAYIKYIAVNVAYTEDTTINLLDYTGTIQKDYGYYKGIFIDAVYVETDNSSNAKFGNNNGSWLQFNKGTILIFNVGEGATVTASFYNANTEETTYTSIDVTGGVCTITALASTYIASITVSYAS